MKSRYSNCLTIMASGAIALMAGLIAVPVQTTIAASPPEVEIQASTNGIAMAFSTSGEREVLIFSVRVVGPDQFVFEDRIQGTSLQWIPPDNLSDGHYDWEAWVVTVDSGAPMRELTPGLQKRSPDHWFDPEAKQTHLASGSFQVDNGMLVPSDRRVEGEESGSLTRRVAAAIVNFLIPSAHAQSGAFDDSVIISGSGPEILLSKNTSPETLWVNRANLSTGHYQLQHVNCLFFCDPDDNPVIFTVERGAPLNTLYMRSSGNVGIGNGAPASRLHVTHTDSDGLRLQNTFGEQVVIGGGWGFGSTGNFFMADPDTSNAFFQVRPNAPQAALVIGANGVGLGTTAPTAPIHVRRFDNTANVLVEDTGTELTTMFQLRNAADPKFLMQNTADNYSWEFRTGTTGATDSFLINRLGSGALEFAVDNGGNARFAGTVRANGVLLTSSREFKTDFEALDELDILNKLASLEISQWRYKTESNETRHIGPVAEEFHEIFGLSDGKTLNMIDTNGITFAAIKALNHENKRLARQNQELVERLERLESLVSPTM